MPKQVQQAAQLQHLGSRRMTLNYRCSNTTTRANMKNNKNLTVSCVNKDKNFIGILTMSLRYFEGQDHAKIYVQFRPVPPPTLIQRLIGFLQEKYDGPLNLAVDLGCGNGQCTFTLASDFSSVLGTDISPAQISQAREWCSELKWENVKFEASPAEKIPVPDNSVQLLTICEAAHWMDLPKVYEEARRALSKNGVFAIVGYHLPLYTPKADVGKAEAVQQVVDEAVRATQSYWPEVAWEVFREYADYIIPFSDFTRERNFPYKRGAKISDIVGSIRSYSPFQSMVKEKGEAAGTELLDNMANRIASILNEGRAKPMTLQEIKDYEFTSTWNYFVLMARS